MAPACVLMAGMENTAHWRDVLVTAMVTELAACQTISRGGSVFVKVDGMDQDVTLDLNRIVMIKWTMIMVCIDSSF